MVTKRLCFVLSRLTRLRSSIREINFQRDVGSYRCFFTCFSRKEYDDYPHKLRLIQPLQEDRKNEEEKERKETEVQIAGSGGRKLVMGNEHIKDHQDVKDRSHIGQHDSDHLENARREIDASGRAVTQSQNEQPLTRSFSLHIHDAGTAPKATFFVNQSGQILSADKQPVSKLDLSAAVPSDVNFILERPSDFNKLPAEQRSAFDQMQSQAVNTFIQRDLNSALKLAGVDTQKLENVTRAASSSLLESQVVASGKGTGLPELTLVNQKAQEEKSINENGKAGLTDRAETAKPSDLASMSPEARQAVNRINHDMPNSHHGHMSSRQVNRHLPGYQGRHHAPGEKEADRVNPEAAALHLKQDQISAQKNMLAETFAPDKQDPYHTIRRNSDHSYSVGRYGTHFNHLHRALSHALPPAVMEQLGHPPDYSKLSAILKEHPELMAKIQENVQNAIKDGDIPSAMADKFKSAESLSSLADFTNKLRGDKGEITRDELDKNLSQAAQDGLAQQEVTRGMKAGAAPAETALAHQLGKDTNQLTDADKADNKPLMDAAGKFYALGLGKERMDNNDSFNWSTTADGQTIAVLAHRMASQIGTVGDCARGPRQTFDQLGFHLPRAVATVQGQMLEQSGLFKEVSDPRPGDYGYRHWNAAVTRAHGGVDKGDAFIVVGQDSHGRLLGANDHHFVVPPDGGRYRGLKFLRPTEEFFKLYGLQKN